MSVERLQVGIVGNGQVARTRYADVLATVEDVAIVAAVHDVMPEALADVEPWNGARTYADWDVFIQTEDLDVVVILTPGVEHSVLAKRALDQGLHVYSEKPLAYDTETCVQLFDLACQHQRSLVSAPGFAYSPGMRHIKQLIGDKQISLANVWCVEPGPATSPFFAGNSLPYYTWDSRGCLFDLGIYGMDVLVELFGHGASVVGCAAGQRTGRTAVPPDTWHVVLQWPGGTSASLTVSWAGQCDRPPEVVLAGSDITLRAPLWGMANPLTLAVHASPSSEAGVDFSKPTVGWALPEMLRRLAGGDLPSNSEVTIEVTRLLCEVWNRGMA